MSEYKLFQEIIALSVANEWDLAKYEWKLVDIIEADEPEYCLCGHYPIKELCELRNFKNNNTTIVGNHCVNKFMEIKSNKIFESIKKLREDISKSANIETIDFLFEKDLISTWEKDFYSDIFRKRVLSENQLRKKIEVNRKILSIVKKRRLA